MADKQPSDWRQRVLRLAPLGIMLAAAALLLFTPQLRAFKSTGQTSYSELKALVAAGQIAEAEVAATRIVARTKGGAPVEAVRVEDPDLLKDLQRAGVKVTGAAESHLLGTVVAWALPIAVLIGLWTWSARRAGQGGTSAFLSVGRNKAKVYMEKDISVRFDDVAGVDEAKVELQELIDFLKEPGRFTSLGARIPKGVLLAGPPGTGKTLLARAVAGEAGVPFFSISGSEFVELFVGVGAARVRDLFEQAKQKAPCIIFIDELDALGKVRGVGPMAHEEREQTLNQLLVEMDGFDPRVGVILMAATNRPEILDPALLRAGRFDRHVLVDRPDKRGRLAILRVHARKIALEDDAVLEEIAGLTAGFVGADLANLVNEAALLAVRRKQERVGRADLEEAVERVVAGLEKKNRVLTRREKERVAHHEIGHALVALALPGTDKVQKVSIIPRGISALGYTLQAPTEDRFLMTRSELEDKIAVLLGGRAAEEIVFGEISTGAEDDLAKATEVARSMVRSYGMSPRLGARSFAGARRPLFLPAAAEDHRGDYSDATADVIDAEVARIVEEQAARAACVLDARRRVLSDAAVRLLAQETLTGDELAGLLGPPLALAPPAKAVLAS
jgi:cell division protease FtsH